MYNREIKLIGEENFVKLKNSKVIIFGLGGVGGYVAEFVCRAGIGQITLVDFDSIDKTNKNRQIIALDSTLNKMKAIEIQNRLLDIDNSIITNVITDKLTIENINNYNLKNYDYVIDAIDDFKAKCELIKFCYKNKINIVSALGAGNKYSIPNYIVSDIFKTEYDPLARKLRKFAKENCIKKMNVVYSKSETIKVNGSIGSISYHPPACASVLVGFVVNQLIKENFNE